MMVLSPIIVISQEVDDMYFTSSDRKEKKKTKKITPANVILSKYRLGITDLNASDAVDQSIINKYKSEQKNNSVSKNNNLRFKSLKYDRDDLYISQGINSKILDFSFMMLRIRPYYYSIIDPYYYNSLDPFASNLYGGRWMPRSLYGFRSLAVRNPSLFFSNPYLSSVYPMMSPALVNLHAGPSFALYGCNDFLRHFPWIMTNNGTGGGKYYGYLPVHNNMNISSSDESVSVRGPRKVRGSSINGENIRDIKLNDRFYRGRRESGITNENIQRELDEGIRNGTQNSFLRERSTVNNNLSSSRSSRSSIMQSTNRRTSNQYRDANNMADAVNDYFNNSGSRRSLSSQNWMNSRGTNTFTTSNDGRRSNYSYKPYSGGGDNRTSNFNNSNRSNNSFGGFRSNSGGSSSSWGSSSGGSSSYSGGGSSGGGGSVVSAGSSGGSSRGNN